MTRRPDLCDNCKLDEGARCLHEDYHGNGSCAHMRGHYNNGWADAFAEVRAALTVTQYEGMSDTERLRQAERVLARVWKLVEGGERD